MTASGQTYITANDMLLEIIRTGLEKHAEQSTLAQLGDRSRYVGLSDIGLMRECPRAAVLKKIARTSGHTPESNQLQQKLALRRQLVLQRGHWLEEGIGNALKAHNFHLLPQVELCVPECGTPIKVHMDFVLAEELPHPVVRVLELKSTENLPSVPSSAYTLQIHGQISMLAAYWNHPVFTVRDAQGTILSQNLTFSDLCNRHFGITLPQSGKNVDMQGWLLCISMTGAKAFGPYFPDNSILAECLHHAENLWKYMQDCRKDSRAEHNLTTAQGFTPICSWCAHAAGCPKFVGDDQPEWADTMQELSELKEEKDQLQNRINAMEEGIKYSCGNSESLGKWFTSGAYRFRVAEQKGRRTLSKDRLLEELTPFMGQEDAAQLLTACEEEGEPFLRLYTKTV